MRARRTQAVVDLVVDDLGRVVELDAEHLPGEILKQAEGPVGIVGNAVGNVPALGESVLLPFLEQFGDQPALAETSLTDQRDDATLALLEVGQGCVHAGQLLVPPDQRRPDAAVASLAARPWCGSTRKAGTGSLFPFSSTPPSGLDLEERLDQPIGILRDLNGARGGGLFHAGGDVHRVAHGRVFHGLRPSRRHRPPPGRC